MKKIIQHLSLTLIFIGTVAGSCLAEEESSLAVYLEQAFASNSALLTARAELLASKEKISQAGVLPDPKVAVHYYLVPVETRTGPQVAAAAISQSVPWMGKLTKLTELSEYDAAIVGLKLAAVEFDVARQVKEEYIEYGFLGMSQQSVLDNVELLRYLEGVARSRYAGGKATYFDVLKIQIELAKSEEKMQSLTDQAGSLRVRINNLLGSERERSRTMPSSLPQVVLVQDEEEIVSLALSNAPLLHEARQRIFRARTGKELAEKDFYPDFTVSLKTILTGSAEFGDPVDSGKDPIIAGLTMNLPIYRDRRHGRVAEKEATIISAQSSQNQQLRLLTNRIEQNLFAYREAKRRIVLYRDSLLPKVTQQLEVAVNGFQSGQSSILELIDAEKNLLDFRLAESRSVADRALAVARLEALSGKILANWEK